MKAMKRIIKKRLPGSVKRLIINLREQALLASMWFFSRSRFLASLYYWLFSHQFSREQQSVLQGKWLYLRNKGMQKDSSTLLRRNIHRIEKGLIMQPQKAIFALEYIEETVNAFQYAKNSAAHDQQEIQWARDVLSAYFSTVQLDLLPPAIKQTFDAAHSGNDCKLEEDCYISENREEKRGCIPYHFSSKMQSKVTVDQFSDLCMQRRSVRWFEPKPVPRELLEQAVEIAAQAPSACNRIPYQFYIADDKDILQKLISTPLGTRGFSHNVPCSIVVTADLGHYPSERDRHLIYIDSSLASMQLMLALETLGLSSCPINWPDIEEKERQMASMLELSDSVRPVMLIAVGYGCAQGKIPFSQKKSAAQLVRYVND